MSAGAGSPLWLELVYVLAIDPLERQDPRAALLAGVLRDEKRGTDIAKEGMGPSKVLGVLSLEVVVQLLPLKGEGVGCGRGRSDGRSREVRA